MTARPIVIAGASRSGTSVLAQMLSLHSQVRGLGEIHFFEQFWTPSTAHCTLTHGEAQIMAGRLLHHALDAFYRPYRAEAHASLAAGLVDGLPSPIRATDVYRSVLAHCAGGSAWVIDKTPRYVAWIPEILRLLPDAIIGVITRDPRDVLLSQKRWHRT